MQRLLIANRGEIACRIICTARAMGIYTIAVYSEADAQALHVELADEAHLIGPAEATKSYLDIRKIVDLAKSTSADAVHPGYGFLSENPEFAEELEQLDIRLVGPSAQVIRAMGLKDRAKEILGAAGVPVVPGDLGADQGADALKASVDQIGYPVLIKARAGGGGKGMRLVEAASDFDAALSSAKSEAAASFGDDHVIIEKFIQNPRHIEVQIFGDDHGNVVHLFERDCSMQRRHQKVIEEAPAPGMTDDMRAAITEAAVKAAKEIGYSGAGTVEFIADGSRGLRADGFWFMEMNTRLQVEHPVTEAVTGLDLVEWQLRVARGETLPLAQDEISLQGHAVEARIYAEDPSNNFLPTPGDVSALMFGDARIDTGVREGDTVSPPYDPMISKLIVQGKDREEAIEWATKAIQQSLIGGTQTNLDFIHALLQDEDFRSGKLDTGLIDRKIDALTHAGQASPRDWALGALAMLGLNAESDHFGFTHFGPSRGMIWISQEASSKKVEIQQVKPRSYRISVEGDEIEFAEFSFRENQIFYRFDGVVYSHPFKTVCDQTYINIEGQTHCFKQKTRLKEVQVNSSVSGQVIAPMIGVVKSVACKIGDEVADGTPLVTMEAMKMEMALTATRTGKIKAVLVSEGASVSKGDILVEMEPTDG